MHFKNLLKVSCYFILLCLFALPALAQNVVVSGKVTDSKDGSPIPGVSIVAKGSTSGTVTDANGNFKLSVPSSVKALSVSFVGYVKKDVALTGGPLNITLDATSTALNEVLVVSVGYGSARKKDVTGAVENISAKNFNQGAIINPIDQLSGKVAGLTITQPGGDPNQVASVRLRGQSSLSGGLSPLFVVDGVILDDPSQFQNIPPDDIASYDVLKDASAAAIYGSRGANGVIIVTTKKGASGKAVISYDGIAGFSKQSKYYDLLTPSEYLAELNLLASQDTAIKVATYAKGGVTDWQRAITRTAYQQRHSVSLSGGNSSSNYIASANYSNQQGIVINTGKQQLGLRFSGETKALDDKLDIKAGIQNISTVRSFLDYSNFSYMYNSPPTFPVKNPDGSYFAYTDFNEANPVEHINQTTAKAYEYLTLINGSVDYNITHELKIGGNGAISRNNVQTHGFVPSFPVEGNVNQGGQAQENTNSYKGNLHLNFDKTFGKSTLNFIAAYEYNDYLYDNFVAAGQQYIIPEQLDNNLGAGNSQFNRIFSYKNEYTLISYFARAAYNYDGRIYVTATLRRDGSSKFGSQNQWGTFPSFDLAYRFKKDLLANVDWITDLKLRAGYGVTGNADAISPYGTLETVNSVGKYFDASSGSYLSAYSTNQNANPLLKWEERQGKNVGLDFDLFNGRLSGSMNYFNDKTKNLLYDYTVPTPPFVVNTLLANVGTMTNKGFELSLTGQILTGPKLRWTASGQISFVNTKIDNLSGSFAYAGKTYPLTASQIPVGYARGRGLSSNPITFLKPGYSPYVFYLPHYTGVDASGNQTFDGQTIDQNASPAGHYIDPAPKFNYGFSNSFDYGNWNLNFALRGVYGQKIFNNTLLDVQTVTRLPGNNVTREALTNGIKDAPVASDLWLENASFLRMDNATLSYSFKNISFASNLRVFISSNNVFVITKYKGLDPEVKTENSSGTNILFGQNLNGSNNQAYIDANYGGEAYYPRVRTFSLGVNVTLK
ncbi:SusC/RagA family TonB-linked outer membrane protein [Mucilaginibacter sp. BT774]|uniref:SusC/RagA family TonB-linked outer membrane protein n=1 Tax=Mucilaginibacter sp. BT774 TaxID=3062276 RepID=UPI0026755772|nr:SusC/RagA family TonB-linked outer membrane protein [Mucilaginibacter sp. BT774]MDO3628081.1 SusC/RagA family TonB-linked outer membrane protein [Mucilaginibacter sp. BT774]